MPSIHRLRERQKNKINFSPLPLFAVRQLEHQRTSGEIKKECSSESDITDIDEEHTTIGIASPPQTAAARKAAQNRKIKSTAPYNSKIVYQ